MTGVYGAQGSGKTLDILARALLAHPGAAIAALTKADDRLLISIRGRPSSTGQSTGESGSTACPAPGHAAGRSRSWTVPADPSAKRRKA